MRRGRYINWLTTLLHTAFCCRLDLANALSSLPAPQFDYEIAAPEIEPEEDEADNKGAQIEEDQEDVERRLAEIKRLEAEVEFAKRSSVIKRKEEVRGVR